MKATLSLLLAGFPSLPIEKAGNTLLAAHADAVPARKFLRFILTYPIPIAAQTDLFWTIVSLRYIRRHFLDGR